MPVATATARASTARPHTRVDESIFVGYRWGGVSSRPRDIEMNPIPRILVVEDDAPTAASIVRALRAEGHDVELEVRGDRALATVHASRFDLVILDLRLPEVHGFEILEALRHRGHASVLVVSASSELEARLRVFELGADDFVPKPFWTEELLARVRRRLARPVARDAPATIGTLAIDPARRVVSVEGRAIELTKTEVDLLCALTSANGAAVTRATLADDVLGAGVDPRGRTVDSHVAHLRRKLGPAGRYLRTVWGIGYRLAEEDA
ncbi:Phosphate regulon transcriptional regulatory protein PhoB (SphR) [Minicystis rosea]|nr:Phosphate regulon transcriptional regulatory protein PhoB (SphR) [Minicystis rosea]